MLSHKVLTRADLNDMGRYYAEAEDDYYTKELDASEWQGKGAERLGLEGEVDRARFQQLLAGQVKPGIEISRTSKRNDTKERIGIDLTFSAPKSVSIQALAGGDARLVKAHEEAVAATIAHAETLAQARVKTGGKAGVVDTGNLIVAKFRHETSREQDPQLHTHAVVMNLTRRGDGQWRALRNDNIIKSVSYLGAHYRAELAVRLTQLGYELRHGRDGMFELAHIDRKQLLAFSDRAAAIEAALAKKGIDRETATTAEKQAATMNTRPKKEATDREALWQRWKETAKEVGIQLDRPAAPHQAERPGIEADGKSGRQATPREAAGQQGRPEADQGHPRAGAEAGERQERPQARPGEHHAGIEDAGRPGQQATPRDTGSSPVRQVGAEAEQLRAMATARAADKAVRYAVHHLTERQAIVRETELLDTATKHGMGHVTVADVRQAIARMTQDGRLLRESPLYKAADDLKSAGARTQQQWAAILVEKGATSDQAARHVEQGIAQGRLIAAESRFTTQGALATERSILNLERAGRGAPAPILDAEAGRAKLADSFLNERQRQAATEILASNNRIIGVQGLAGTGKTTMLSASKALAEEAGYRMVAIAPYGSQVKALQQSGFEAQTVMAFVRAKERNLDSKTILVLDEAGVMPTRLMERTLREAEKAGARVVLLGDTGQTKAIEAGKPFEQLQAAGMQTVRLDEIIRQNDPRLKSAVIDAAHGRSVNALAKITDVAVIPENEARWTRIVKDYMAMSVADRSETLIVSGTNEARQAINAMVRDSEQRVGTGQSYDTLIRRDTTQAERRFAKNYNIGDAIQPERDYKRIGLERGHTYRVVENGPDNRLTVENANGERVTFSPMVHNRLSVYALEKKEIAPGDRIRITRNDAGMDLANGDRFTVKSVGKQEIVLTSDKREVRLPADKPLHVDYAYASTVHSAQGLTSKNVMYDADSRSPTTTREVFYVAISRAREKATIYTNDADRLPAAVARSTQKHGALDLVRGRAGQGNGLHLAESNSHAHAPRRVDRPVPTHDRTR
ncbi:MobF family relaxase [Xanthomonas phaseoli]|uniref:MobF family relaxase n=1 Tax=Xanthomonas phaseoli TaxID=1985254 RepID=UPI0002E406E3|nr:MobF family relaxase [Xanthomonas phaseoli]